MTDPDAFRADWDVYRDATGSPVTITWQQVNAIRHAYSVWQRVCRAEGNDTQTDMTNPANWMKSCLLGRMLVEGRRPLRHKPPLVDSAPAYHLVDPDLCRYCGKAVDGPGGSLGGSLVPPQRLVDSWRQHHYEVGKTFTRVVCAENWHRG